MNPLGSGRKRLRTGEPAAFTKNAVCCSTCLSTERTLFSLQNTPELRTVCRGLDLSDTDMVCWECRARLNNFVRFRTQAQRAKKLLSRVPAKARSSEYQLTQIFFSSGIKCLSPLAQAVISPYQFLYMGAANVQLNFNTDSDDDNGLKPEADSDSEIQDTFNDNDSDNDNAGNDTVVLLQVGDNVVSMMDAETAAGELNQSLKNESDVVYDDDDGNVAMNVSYEDYQELDEHSKTSPETVQLKPGRAVRSRPNVKIAMHFIKVEVKLEDVIAQMDVVRKSARFRRAKYKCDLCAVTFFAENKYKLHQMCHSEKRGDFACAVCTQRFKNTYEVQMHTNSHYVRYQCRHCKKQYENYTQMYSHYIDLHENEKEKRCSKCTRTFATRSEFKYHVERYHKIQLKHSCEVCERTYSTKGALHRHMLQHDESVPELECPVCHRKYKGEPNLKLHLRNVHFVQPGETYCAECDSNFETPQRYKKHLRTAKHLTPDDYLYVCDYCAKRYAEKNVLQLHIQSKHLQLANHPCDVCGVRFNTKRHLQRHKKKVHSLVPIEKKHVCHVCAKAFAVKHQLSQHMNTHTGVRAYKCTPCGKSFMYRSALYSHNRLAHFNSGIIDWASKTIVIKKKAPEAVDTEQG